MENCDGADSKSVQILFVFEKEKCVGRLTSAAPPDTGHGRLWLFRRKYGLHGDLKAQPCSPVGHCVTACRVFPISLDPIKGMAPANGGAGFEVGLIIDSTAS